MAPGSISLPSRIFEAESYVRSAERSLARTRPLSCAIPRTLPSGFDNAEIKAPAYDPRQVSGSYDQVRA